MEREFLKKEFAKKINRFLGELPETERRVFLCRYWYMDSVKEIAERFGYSESKTASMLHRTRGKLQKMLEKEGFI